MQVQCTFRMLEFVFSISILVLITSLAIFGTVAILRGRSFR